MNLQQLINTLLGAAPEVGKGLVRGMTADVVGAPVDTLNAVRQGLLAPAEAGNPYARQLGGLLGPVQQTGSSDYFAQQMGLPEGQGMAYEAGRMLSPSPSDLMSLARRAPSIQELITYHGTPHQFPATEANPLGEFDASKIGSGEGAQAYGHGIYLAESPDVAGQYKASTSANMYDTSKGVIRSSDLVDELFKQSGDIPKNLESAYRAEANEVVRDLIMGKSSSEISQEIRTSKYGRTYNALADAVDSLSPKSTSGQLYSADLPDEMIDKMLDWDKPLSEQPKSVQPILREMLLKSKKSFSEIDEKSNPMAGQIHHLYAMHRGGNSAAVAEELRQKGIPGIKYLDQGSRGEGKGTRNFVVFPGEEKKVKILKRD